VSVYFYNTITLLGGIALFLYGLSEVTDSFRSAFSARAREAVSRFTRGKKRAMLFGAVLAAVAQGSTVSTSIAIALADVGMLTLTGSVVVMMGASIGGTFVTLLISLDIVRLSPLFMAVSYAAVRLGRGWLEKAAKVLHSISLLLVGMFLLRLGIDPLLDNPYARDAIVGITSEPFTVFFAAFAGTAFLQSSASVMALTVAIASSGALPQNAVFPIVLGAHLGSTIAVLLAASGGRHNARVLGVATFLYKLAGTLLFVPLMPWANVFLDNFMMPMAARIVLSQMLIMFFNAAIFYPWPHVLVSASVYVLSRQKTADLGAPVYLDDQLLEIPSLAVKLLSKEMIRLTNYIEAYLQMRLLPEKSGGELENLLPEAITDLTSACENYAYSIPPPPVSDKLALTEYKTVKYAMLSLREVSRITVGPFAEGAEKVAEKHGVNPPAGEMDDAECSTLKSLFMKTMRHAFHAFSLGDSKLAEKALYGGAKFEKMTAMLRSSLLKRGDGDDLRLLDFIAVKERMIRASLDMVRGDAIAEGEKSFGQK